MDIKLVSEIIDDAFPNNLGILLTGSQVNNEIFLTTSDIDVVVIEPIYSNIHARGIRTAENFVIDVVILPLFNIEELFDNECYDTKGGLFSMLSKARVIKDSLKIASEIKEKATVLYNTFEAKIPILVDQQIIELLKIRKNFCKPLSDYQKIYLTSDLISLVSTLEVSRSSKWAPTRRHKADYLIKNNLEFTKKIYSLFANAVFGVQNSDVIEFIDAFYKTLSDEFNDGVLKNKIVCFDLKLSSVIPTTFYNTILPRIINEFNSSFSSSYFSVKKYHRKYKNNITICLDLNTRQEILNALQCFSRIIKGESASNFEYEIFLEAKESESYRAELKLLLTKDVIKDFSNSETPSKSLYLHKFAFLSSFISTSLNLKVLDLIKIHEAHSQKWIFNRQEQEENKELLQLVQLQSRKNGYGSSYYQNNQELFNAIIKHGTLISKSSEFNNNPFELYDILSFLDITLKAELNLNSFNLFKFILEKLEFSDIRNLLIYSSILDLLAQIFPFTEEEIWLVNNVLKNYYIQELSINNLKHAVAV